MAVRIIIVSINNGKTDIYCISTDEFMKQANYFIYYRDAFALLYYELISVALFAFGTQQTSFYRWT